MAVDNASITVGTTPTKLCEADTGAYIANGDAAAIFVCGPHVLSAAESPTVTPTRTDW